MPSLVRALNKAAGCLFLLVLMGGIDRADDIESKRKGIGVCRLFSLKSTSKPVQALTPLKVKLMIGRFIGLLSRIT